jgi:hypothetical protein
MVASSRAQSSAKLPFELPSFPLLEAGRLTVFRAVPGTCPARCRCGRQRGSGVAPRHFVHCEICEPRGGTTGADRFGIPRFPSPLIRVGSFVIVATGRGLAGWFVYPLWGGQRAAWPALDPARVDPGGLGGRGYHRAERAAAARAAASDRPEARARRARSHRRSRWAKRRAASARAAPLRVGRYGWGRSRIAAPAHICQWLSESA